MTTSPDFLGGRLALLQPDGLSSAQQKLYDQLQATMVPWAEKSGFRAQNDDKQLIGPFNPMLRSPEIATAVLAVNSAEEKHTALSEKVRQVVILTVGAVWQAGYELYAHAAVARQAGFDETTIRLLAAGQKPATLAEEEALAYDFTYALAKEHHINPDVYRRALAVFEEKGVADMVFLAGQYMTISALLNTFAVPIPA